MKKGFTLIELLIVLVIIGIIVGLILPNTLRAIQLANRRECISNIRTINTAAQLCYTTTRNWAECGTVADLSKARADGKPFLDHTPVCPFGDAYALAGNNDAGFDVTTTTHFAGDFPPASGTKHVGE